MSDIHPTLVGEEALRNRHIFREDMQLTFSLLSRVLYDQDLIRSLCLSLVEITHFLKGRVIIELTSIQVCEHSPANTPHRIYRVHTRRSRPEATRTIKSKVDRVNQPIFLRSDQLNHKPFWHSELL